MEKELAIAAGKRKDLIDKGRMMMVAGYSLDAVLDVLRRDASIRKDCVEEDRYDRGIRKLRLGKGYA